MPLIKQKNVGLDIVHIMEVEYSLSHFNISLYCNYTIIHIRLEYIGNVLYEINIYLSLKA